MFTKMTFAGFLFVGLAMSVVTVQADELEPALRVRSLTGTVMVQRAGEADFAPIEEGRAYAYGSRFRTGPDSEVRLVMSGENHVRVMQGTEMVFAENRQDPKSKIVRLLNGEVEANLAPTFHEGGNMLTIEAANAVTQAVGTQYRVASRYDEDLYIVVIRVLSGIVRVMGENFEVAELKADQYMSLLSPPDESFLRFKNMKGTYDITIKGDDKENLALPTEEGSVLKIWQRIVPETGERVVTAIFSGPDGKMQDPISITFAAGEMADFLADVPVDPSEWERLDVEERPGRRETDEDGENPMPPDEFLDELVERSLEGLMPGVGRTPPRLPLRDTPTPVGNR